MFASFFSICNTNMNNLSLSRPFSAALPKELFHTNYLNLAANSLENVNKSEMEGMYGVQYSPILRL